MPGDERNIGHTAPRAFDATRIWVFDLDNTLYPADCNLFAEIDQRMGTFIQRHLDVPWEHARYLQKHYYRQYGTTLAGLMREHKMAPDAFLDYVHDIDLSPLPELPGLAVEIARLPGRKIIFTAGSRRHAERVAEKLGVLHLFDGICDIVGTGYVPKEQREAYDRFVRAHDVLPEQAAMFEDMPHNLVAAHDLGMTTVLVHSTYMDHPAQAKIKTWKTPPAHVHHMTDDLVRFLGALKP